MEQPYRRGRRHALWISGRLTCHEKRLIPQLNHYLTKYPEEKIDVYISVSHPVQTPLNSLEVLTDQPIKIYTEDLESWGLYENHPSKRRETNARNTLSMFYHNQKAFEMIESSEHYEQYTWVIKWRPDLMNPVLPSELLQTDPTENTLYVPQGDDHGGLNDRLAMGSATVMKKYASIYTDIIASIPLFQYVVHPETILLHHLQKQPTPLTIHRFAYDCTLDLDRNILVA